MKAQRQLARKEQRHRKPASSHMLHQTNDSEDLRQTLEGLKPGFNLFEILTSVSNLEDFPQAKRRKKTKNHPLQTGIDHRYCHFSHSNHSNGTINPVIPMAQSVAHRDDDTVDDTSKKEHVFSPSIICTAESKASQIPSSVSTMVKLPADFDISVPDEPHSTPLPEDEVEEADGSVTTQLHDQYDDLQIPFGDNLEYLWPCLEIPLSKSRQDDNNTTQFILGNANLYTDPGLGNFVTASLPSFRYDYSAEALHFLTGIQEENHSPIEPVAYLSVDEIADGWIDLDEVEKRVREDDTDINEWIIVMPLMA